MTQFNFGGGSADFLFSNTVIGGVDLMSLSGGTLTFWSAATGGTQQTVTYNGNPVTSISVGSTGQIPNFLGPAGVTNLWADAGGNARVQMWAYDIAVATTDAGVAAVVGDSSSATRAALSATFAAFVNLAKNPDTIITGSITRNANEVVTSAAVVWPDGATGTFTATTVNATYNTIDAYTVTHVVGGVTHTWTQPTITRDSTGAATNVPAMTYV